MADQEPEFYPGPDAPEPVDVITREEWGALPAKATQPMHHPNTKVVVTYDLKIDVCKSKAECIKALQELQRRHMEEGSEDIRYNFLVGGDGNVYEGRGWFNRPCKTLKYPAYHHKRMDIGFIGDYIGTEVLPKRILGRAFDLLEVGINAGYIIRYYDMYEIREPCKLNVEFDPDKMEYEREPVTHPAELGLWNDNSEDTDYGFDDDDVDEDDDKKSSSSSSCDIDDFETWYD